MIQVDTEGVGSVIGPGSEIHLNSDTSINKPEGFKPMAIRSAERRLSELYFLIGQANASAKLAELYREEYDEISDFIGAYNNGELS